MVSITKSPPSHAFTGQSIPVEFQSSLFTLGKSSIELAFSDFVNAGESITIKWEGNEVVMTAATSPDGSGKQFPTSDTTLDSFVDAVREHFLQNETLLQNTDISRINVAGAEKIKISFPANEVITITESNDLNNCTVSISNFAGLAQDNLRAFVRLYQVGNLKDEFLGALHGTYSTTDLKSKVDLSELIELAPHVPNSSSMQSWEYGVATNAFASCYFRYADKYGYPAVAEALQKSATFYIVAGAVENNPTKDFFAILRPWTCHNYKTIGSVEYPKIVTLTQPDYFYFYSKSELNNYRIHCVLTWSDGTQSQHVVKGDISLQANTMYWFSSGYLQCGLSGVSNGSEIITHYQFAIGNLDQPGNVDSFTVHTGVHYEIDMDMGRNWNTYLFAFNGVGGCESVGFFGKTGREVEKEADVVELADSTRENFQPRTRRKLELNSGYFDERYIEHYEQLLTGKLWLIDMEHNRFLPVRLLTDTLPLPGDDTAPEVNAITIEVELAQEEQVYNDY